MALPTPTIVGQGRVESELIFTWNGKGDGQRHNFQAGNSSLILTLNTGNEYDIEAYKITASPADGWKFDHWKYLEESQTEYASIQGSTVIDTLILHNNPTISRTDHSSSSLPIGLWTETSFRSSGDWSGTDRFRCLGLTAVFVPINPVGQPLLVHDPVTRRLVHANNRLLNGM